MPEDPCSCLLPLYSICLPVTATSITAPILNERYITSNSGITCRATYRLTDLSTAERFHRWIGGIRMTEGHLLHGYGPNGFYYAYKPYTVSAFQTYVSVNEERSTVHNYFLLLLIEQGIPGLVIFCLLLGVLFYYAHQWYHTASDKRERIYAAAVAAMLGMIVSLNLLSDLVETDKIGGLFFICVGILLTRQFIKANCLAWQLMILYRLTSMASLNPLPKILKASTSTMIASPGMMASMGLWVMMKL